jgi:hypothetical protein
MVQDVNQIYRSEDEEVENKDAPVCRNRKCLSETLVPYVLVQPHNAGIWWNAGRGHDHVTQFKPLRRTRWHLRIASFFMRIFILLLSH